MKYVCATFDNPATMAREAWVNGRMIAHITADALIQKGFRGGPWFPFYLNIGEWREGMILGDPGAIKGRGGL